MKQLREQIKKEIKKLSEELGMRKYPLPPEIKMSLERDLKLRPLIRYINNVKAANTVPPSYMIFLHNGQSFQLYIEQTSIVAKIGIKSYWLMNQLTVLLQFLVHPAASNLVHSSVLLLRYQN